MESLVTKLLYLSVKVTVPIQGASTKSAKNYEIFKAIEYLKYGELFAVLHIIQELTRTDFNFEMRYNLVIQKGI